MSISYTPGEPTYQVIIADPGGQTPEYERRLELTAARTDGYANLPAGALDSAMETFADALDAAVGVDRVDKRWTASGVDSWSYTP